MALSVLLDRAELNDHGVIGEYQLGIPTCWPSAEAALQAILDRSGTGSQRSACPLGEKY